MSVAAWRHHERHPLPERLFGKPLLEEAGPPRPIHRSRRTRKGAVSVLCRTKRKYDEMGQARHLRRSEEHTSEPQSLMSTSYAVFCLKHKHEYPTLYPDT